jgi:hypothetical protein
MKKGLDVKVSRYIITFLINLFLIVINAQIFFNIDLSYVKLESILYFKRLFLAYIHLQF